MQESQIKQSIESGFASLEAEKTLYQKFTTNFIWLIKNIILLPVLLLRLILSIAIIPAAWLPSQSMSDEQLKDQAITKFAFSGVSNFYYKQNTTNQNKSLQNRQIILYFAGSGENHDSLQNIEHNQDDIIFVDHPAYVMSTRTLVDNAKNIIKGLIKSGLDPEKLTIVGFSLGGAIALVALTELQKEDSNFRQIKEFKQFSSFTNLPTVVTEKQWLATLLKGLLKLLDLGDLDAKAAYDSGSIPAKKQSFYYNTKDPLIPGRASFAQDMKFKSDNMIHTIIPIPNSDLKFRFSTYLDQNKSVVLTSTVNEYIHPHATFRTLYLNQAIPQNTFAPIFNY
jgi:hypothetical protein